MIQGDGLFFNRCVAHCYQQLFLYKLRLLCWIFSWFSGFRRHQNEGNLLMAFILYDLILWNLTSSCARNLHFRIAVPYVACPDLLCSLLLCCWAINSCMDSCHLTDNSYSVTSCHQNPIWRPWYGKGTVYAAYIYIYL